MTGFILRRLLHALPLLLAVVVLVFLLIAFTPGTRSCCWWGTFRRRRSTWNRCGASTGWTGRLGVQLWRYLAKVVQGDFGFSFAAQQPVAALIVARLG